MEGIVSVVNSTDVPLDFAGIFDGEYEDVRHFSSVTVAIISDVVGSTNGLELLWSDDGIFDYLADDVYTYNPALGPFSVQTFTSPRRAKFFRVRFSNFSAPMSFFRLQVIYDYNTPQLQYRRLGDSLNGEDQAVPSKSTIWALHQPTGAFIPAIMTASGGVRVAVGEPLASGTNHIGRVTVSGTTAVSGAVAVTGTTAVSGTVSVGNFPATQAVSGTVSVGNFPAVQPVSDNSGSLTVDDGGTTLSVDDGAGSLTVDGTVAVSNFPATQAVSGTVTISGTAVVSGTVNQGTSPWIVSGSTPGFLGRYALSDDQGGVGAVSKYLMWNPAGSGVTCRVYRLMAYLTSVAARAGGTLVVLRVTGFTGGTDRTPALMPTKRSSYPASPVEFWYSPGTVSGTESNMMSFTGSEVTTANTSGPTTDWFALDYEDSIFLDEEEGLFFEAKDADDGDNRWRITFHWEEIDN